MLVAPATTWLFVRTSPEEVSTMPVPAAFPPRYARTVLMSTMLGFTLPTIAWTWEERAPAAEVSEPSMAVESLADVDPEPERNRVARPTPRTDERNTATTRAATAKGLLRFGGAGGGCIGP